MDINKIKQVLQEEGFRIEEGEGASIVFKFQSGNYYIDTDARDDEYIRIGYPRLWVVESSEQYFSVVETANQVTEQLKAVKVYVSKGAVHCTVEQYLMKPEDLATLLPRYLAAIQGATNKFTELMRARV